MEPAPKRQKKTKPVSILEPFATQIAAWDVLAEASGDGFPVALFQSCENGCSREYRTRFRSEESARRFWTFCRAIETTWHGAAVMLMEMLVGMMGDDDQLVTEVWRDEFVRLVGEKKLERTAWHQASSKGESWDNLEQDWSDICPSEPIRACFRLASYF